MCVRKCGFPLDQDQGFDKSNQSADCVMCFSLTPVLFRGRFSFVRFGWGNGGYLNGLFWPRGKSRKNILALFRTTARSVVGGRLIERCGRFCTDLKIFLDANQTVKYELSVCGFGFEELCNLCVCFFINTKLNF